MPRIRQGYVSENYLNLKFLDQYQLSLYKNNKSPSFFVGLCDKADFEVVKKHKSMAVIIWDGYLIRQKLVGKYQSILSGSNIYHLTISNNIAELGDLFRINLIPTQIVVSVVDLNFYYPTQLGPFVFVATDSQYPEKYGEIYYIKMQKIFPNIKFVIVSNDNAEELRLLYSSCFIGLHLTDNYHVLSDGRVQELGLCGIKCVHNSNLPNALKWESEQDIVNHIKTEYEKIGDNTALRKVAQDVHNYLNTEPDWIRTKFYDGVVVKKPAMVLEKPVMVLEKPVVVLEKPVVVLEKPKEILEKVLEKPEVLVIESRVPSPHWDTGDYSVTVIMPVYGEKSEYLVSAIDGYLRQRNIKLQKK